MSTPDTSNLDVSNYDDFLSAGGSNGDDEEGRTATKFVDGASRARKSASERANLSRRGNHRGSVAKGPKIRSSSDFSHPPILMCAAVPIVLLFLSLTPFIPYIVPHLTGESSAAKPPPNNRTVAPALDSPLPASKTSASCHGQLCSARSDSRSVSSPLRRFVYPIFSAILSPFRTIHSLLSRLFRRRRPTAPSRPPPHTETGKIPASPSSHLTPEQYDLLLTYQSLLPSPRRRNEASWGGPGLAYSYPFDSSDLHTLEAYLTVQGWPADFTTKWPDCKKGCPSTQPWEETLEWRLSYEPWSVTPSMLTENDRGWIYTRGFTSGPVKQPVIWYRPGLHVVDDEDAYVRCIIYTLDRAGAVASSGGADLEHLGKKGREDPRRYFVVLDAEGFKASQVPSMGQVKKMFDVVGRNFPRRLGKLYIVNLSTAAGWFWRLVRPLLAEDVKKKVEVIQRRVGEGGDLGGDIGMEAVPGWLGGGDEWDWDVADYYGIGSK